MNRSKRITGIASLVAIEVALCFISNYITIGPVNVNLALIPIAVGAFLYGPYIGMTLGFVNGIITLLAPGTLFFITINLPATIFLCLFKTGLGGLVVGFIYKSVKNTSYALIIGSILIPLINTFLFICGVYLFYFEDYLELIKPTMTNTEGLSTTIIILTSVLTINFLVEVLTCTLLSPTICYSLKKYTK